MNVFIKKLDVPISVPTRLAPFNALVTSDTNWEAMAKAVRTLMNAQ